MTLYISSVHVSCEQRMVAVLTQDLVGIICGLCFTTATAVSPSHESPMGITSQPHLRQKLPTGQFRFSQVGAGPLGAGGLGTVYRIRVDASNAIGIPIGS